MHNWFQCKIKYERSGEDGSNTKVNESYLVDALSFTEAEKRINEIMQPFINGEFLVSDIKRMKINELIENEDENSDSRWYRSKVNLVTFDEEKEVEKRTAFILLAEASTLKEAVDLVDKAMKTSLSHYEIVSVVETNIIDVYKITD